MYIYYAIAEATNATHIRISPKTLPKIQVSRLCYSSLLKVAFGRNRCRRCRGCSRRRFAILPSGKQLFLTKADGLRHLGEANARVEDGHCNSCNGAHDAVQRDELGFVLHERIAPPAHHLCNPIHASREDGKEGDDHCPRKELEAHGLQLRVGWRLVVVRGSTAKGEMPAEEEEARQRGEDCQRDNLHDDAGDGNVASEVQLAEVVVGAGGQASADRLQTE